jgi:RnfABCDGE-type electron transport complex D subunit
MHGANVSKQSVIKWQKPMNQVLYALIPVILASIYFFGWRSLCMLVVVNLFAFLSEYCFAKYYKNQVTAAVFVTGTLFALSLPPNLPYWMAVIGIVFGVVFGKMVFGGFGKNIFNPAIVGRAFIYINFTTQMNGRWFEPVAGKLGGLVNYTTDAICSATPMQVVKAGESMSLIDLLVGNTAGCFGETSALLLILGGIYIIWKKVANYRLIVSCLGTFLILQSALWFSGVKESIPPLEAMLSGGFMLGLIFMVTEPVSAPKTNIGRWIYGGLIGVLTVLIRTFSIWPEGMMFAILIGNMFAPLTDFYVKELTGKKK